MPECAATGTGCGRPRFWVEHWDPENPIWQTLAKRVAARNLWCSILVEHVGFSVWSLFSVFVLSMGPG